MAKPKREVVGDLVFAFWTWVGLAVFTFVALWFWGVLLGDWSIGTVAAFTAIVMGLALVFGAIRLVWKRWRSRRAGV